MVENTELPLTLDQVEQELNGIAAALASHETTLFHVVAAMNAIQRAIVEKGVTTDPEIQVLMKEEAGKLERAFIEHMRKQSGVDTVAANG